MSQLKLSAFFKPTSAKEITADKIVKGILGDLISNVVESTSKKKHDGTKLNDKTLKTWKSSFPWLKTFNDDSGALRLRCDVCTQYNVKSVWNTEGTTNVQKSTIERHAESAPHAEGMKMNIKDQISKETSAL